MTRSRFHLPPGWGDACLVSGWRNRPHRGGSSDIPAGGSARSYDHTGTMLLWDPPGFLDRGSLQEPEPAGRVRNAACDLEHLHRFSGSRDPSPLGPAFRPDTWVATEVTAKLTETPVLLLLRRHGPVFARPGPAQELDLGRYGSAGRARIWIGASDDGLRLAAFGVRLDDA